MPDGMVKRPFVVLLLLYGICMIIVHLSQESSWYAYLFYIPLIATMYRFLGPIWIWYTVFILGCTLHLMSMRFVPADDPGFWDLPEDSVLPMLLVVEDTGSTSSGRQKISAKIIMIDDLNVNARTILYLKERVNVTGGDSLSGSFTLQKPQRAHNPFEFDYRAYLAAKNIHYVLRAADSLEVRTCEEGNVVFFRVLTSIRTAVRTHIGTHLGQIEAGVLLALIMGDKGGLDQEIREDFARTGTIHVLAVSGLHVGYVTLILFVISGFLRMTYRFQVIFTIAGLGFYILFTGAAPSVIRASCMAGIYLIGSLFERRSDLYNILAAAALIMLIFDPGQLNQIGFQLSFAAVFSIVTFFPLLRTALVHFLPEKFRAGLISRVLDLLLVSLAAQLGTLPITLLYFHRLPLIGSLVNLLVVPTVGIIVALGFALLILGSWIPWVASAWGILLTYIIRIMTGIVSRVSELPLAYIDTPDISVSMTIAMSVTILGGFLFKHRYRIVFLTGALLLWSNYAMWKPVLRPAPQLEAVFLDVGQGDAAVLHTGSGKTIVFDTGPRIHGRDSGKDVIAPYLKRRGWGHIDLLVLSHPHNDHVGGTGFLMKEFEVERLWIPPAEYDSRGYAYILSLALDLGIHVDTVGCGVRDDSLWPLRLEVLSPPQGWATHQPSNINDMSLVVKVSCGESRLLITGDAERRAERMQLPFQNILDADILKVGHHGSITSSSYSYLDAVLPEYAIISVGNNNKFRHPSSKTLEKLKDRGAIISRTDHEGAIIFRTDGREWQRVQWRD